MSSVCRPAAFVGEGLKGRLLAATEIVLVAVYIHATLWVVGPNVERTGMAGWTLVSFVAVFLFCVHLSPKYLHGETAEERGIGPARTLFIRTDNLAASGQRVALLTGAALALILAAAWVRDPLVLAHIQWRAVGMRFGYYLFSAGVQAALFFPFFLLRLQQLVLVTGSRRVDGPSGARLGVALLFGLLFSSFHFPNVPLMALTFVAGSVWATAFLGRPNLFTVAVSHALLGTFAHKVLGLSMRVGPFYERSEKVFLTHVVPQLSLLKEILYGP